MSIHTIFKKTVAMTLSTFISQGLGVFTSVAMRRFLGPTAMGIWSILQVALGYCGYASFGTTKALARDYPILRGRGDCVGADNLKNLTFTFSMAMSILPFLMLGIYVALSWDRLELPLRTGFLFICFFLFLQRFYDLVLTLLRSDKKFETFSIVTILNAAGMLVIVFLLVKPFNLYGLFAGSALITVFLLVYVMRSEKYSFRWYWHTGDFFQQLKLAIPLLILSFLTTFFLSLDKLVIARFLGFKEVGYYSIAMMIGSLVTSFPMMLSNVLYPHTLENYGRHSSTAALSNHLHAPAYLMAFVMPIVCGAAFYTVPWIVDVFLKDFEGGIGPMRIYLLGLYFVTLARFSTNILTALDKYWVSIFILIASIIVHVLMSLVLIRLGYSLSGVAWATSISCIVYGIASYFTAACYTEGFFASIRAVSMVLIFFSFFFSCIWIIENSFTMSNPPASRVFFKILFMLIISIPFAWIIEKKFHFFSRLRQSLRPSIK